MMRTGDPDVDNSVAILRAQAEALNARRSELTEDEIDYVDRVLGGYLGELVRKYTEMSDNYRTMKVTAGGGTTQQAFLKALGLLGLMLRNAEIRVNGASAAAIYIEANRLESEVRVTTNPDAAPLQFEPETEPDPRPDFLGAVFGLVLGAVLILALVVMVAMLIVAGNHPASESSSSMPGWLVIPIAGALLWAALKFGAKR